MYNIENMARDLAFEIHLGGDRFGPDDLREWLRGIPEADLKVFRERVLLHAKDFAPEEPMYLSFAERMAGQWLEGVETAEALGREVKAGQSWFNGILLPDDKGKHFLFDDGSIRDCGSATAEAAWGAEARKHILREMTGRDVAAHYADLLISSYGHDRNGAKLVEFITNCSLPDGHVVGLCRDGKGLGFVLDGCVYGADPKEGAVEKQRVAFDKVFAGYPSLVLDAVNYELDERVYKDIREREMKQQDVADFKKKVGELIDRVGERVSTDFLYDQVLLESNAKGDVYVRREVDDLSDNKRFYIYTKTPNGSTVTHVSEDFNAGTLSRLAAAVDVALEALPEKKDVVLDPERISFGDGPVISVPEFTSAEQLTMKVSSLYKGVDGQLMVEGIVKFGGMEMPSSYYLSMLSDKAVKAVREASDKVLSQIQSHVPRPEIKKAAQAEAAVKGRKGLIKQ